MQRPSGIMWPTHDCPTSFFPPMTPMLVGPDHTQSHPMVLSQSHQALPLKPSRNTPPWPWGTWLPSEVMWSSCDDCTTTCHLISRLLSQQTWDLRVPTLFSFNLS